MRAILFIALALAAMPLSGFPFVYPLLLLALTFAFDRRAHIHYGLLHVHLAIAGVVAGIAMYLVRAFFGGPLSFQWPPIAMLVSSVLVEELLFRGYAFKTLADTRGVKIAMVVFAIAFGIYHWVQWNLWSQPAMMLLVLISTGLAHVFFALAFLRSGSLWLPIGLHLGWNLSGQAVRLAGEPFMNGYAISLVVLAIAIAVVSRALPARPLPATSP